MLLCADDVVELEGGQLAVVLVGNDNNPEYDQELDAAPEGMIHVALLGSSDSSGSGSGDGISGGGGSDGISGGTSGETASTHSDLDDLDYHPLDDPDAPPETTVPIASIQRIVERAIDLGDIVKLASDADEPGRPPRSGVVLAMDARCSVRFCTPPGAPSPGVLHNVSSHHLRTVTALEGADMVAFGPWVGALLDVVEEAELALADCDLIARIPTTALVSCQLLTPVSSPFILHKESAFFPGARLRCPPRVLHSATWIGSRPATLATQPLEATIRRIVSRRCSVDWLMCSPYAWGSAAAVTPPRLFQGKELRHLQPVARFVPAIGELLYLDPAAEVEEAAAAAAADAHPDTPERWADYCETGYAAARAVVVEGIASHVRVRWQDTDAEEWLPSTAVRLFHNIAEHEFWAGDHVVLDAANAPDGVAKNGIIMRMDPVARTCVVRWVSDSELVEDREAGQEVLQEQDGEEVSAFDLSDGDESLQFAPGEFVLYTGPLPAGQSCSGCPLHGTPSETQAEDKARLARAPDDCTCPRRARWIGQVLRGEADSRLVVLWADGTVSTSARSRVAHVDTGQGDEDDDGGDIYDDYDDDDVVVDEWGEPGDVQIIDDNGVVTAADNIADDEDDWVTEDEEEGEEEEEGVGEGVEEVEEGVGGEVGEGEGVEGEDAKAAVAMSEDEGGNDVPLFELREAAPESHAFYSTTFQPARMSKFMKAVRSEHKMLMRGLPPHVRVVAFEDRLDLLCAMIVGTEGSLYDGAAFLFDIQLPAEYPAEPPKVFYHSYCKGRLNPNLYEEGKVCLSLLGTWSGQGTETWQSDESSLLQVLVSVQGLVLHNEPYFNEAGYESQRGTAEGRLGSRMYNEMVLLRLLQHMQHMLERPPHCFAEASVDTICRRGAVVAEKLRVLVSDDVEEKDKVLDYPLLPISRGLVGPLMRELDKLRVAIAAKSRE